MSKPQWITAGIAILLLMGLYAATQKHLFGKSKIRKEMAEHDHGHGGFSTDSVLYYAKKALSPEQVIRINSLEHNISGGDVKEEQLHVYHQLARFWRDSARIFAPYAWYTAEAARLENSEKSLTFAAHLFLDGLRLQLSPGLEHWQAEQAQDLFERSLKLNPVNDSSRVGLGAALLYSGHEPPMQAIGRIREVVERDSNHVFAQTILAEASLMSGQFDKALERYERAEQLKPGNLEMIFRVAETAERLGRNKDAARWYNRALQYIDNAPAHIDKAAMKTEVKAKIAKLNQ